jgi:hypothetical protein
MRAVRRVDVDPSLVGTVPGAQYASAFLLSDPRPRDLTPEQWARGAFEDPPRLWRWVLNVGWRFGLGLRLGPSNSRHHVAGWPIAASDAGSIVLAADSRILTARDVFVVSDAGVTWVTIVRFDRPMARIVWGLAAPVHHLTVPWLFRRPSR